MQGVARARWLHFVNVREDLLERSVFLDERVRGLFANPLHTRHVVGRVAKQCEKIHDQFRRNTETLCRVSRVVPLLRRKPGSPVPGVEDPDAGIHELHEILVAGHDHGVYAQACRLSGERSNHVVGFVAVERQHRYVVSGKNLLDALNTRVEVCLLLGLEPFTRGLVRGISLVPERKARVVHPPEVLWFVLCDEPLEKVMRSQRNRGVLSTTAAQRLRAERIERPVDQRVAVDEKEARTWSGRHSRKLTHHGPGDRCVRRARDGGAVFNLARSGLHYLGCGEPLLAAFTANSTDCPSASVLNPSMLIAEKCTKTSSPPSCSIKP